MDRHALLRLAVLALLVSPLAARAWPWGSRGNRKYTVADRVTEFGADVQKRLAPEFEKAGVAYPPKAMTLVVFKKERRVELYASDSGQLKKIKDYSIRAASGELGPKLREGDSQVPEGVYGIESLNPNSQYHLSLRVNYPNAFDRAKARAEGRKNLGGDIMIHGKAVSIGCVALGDAAAEELFVLGAKTGASAIRVIIAPVDLRRSEAPKKGVPAWAPELYALVRAELDKLPKP